MGQAARLQLLGATGYDSELPRQRYVPFNARLTTVGTPCCRSRQRQIVQSTDCLDGSGSSGAEHHMHGSPNILSFMPATQQCSRIQVDTWELFQSSNACFRRNPCPSCGSILASHSDSKQVPFLVLGGRSLCERLQTLLWRL